MMGDEKTVVLKPETLAVVKAKAEAGCVLCRFVLQSLGPNNELADWSPDGDKSKAEFPVDGQVFHVKGETRT